MKKLLLFLLGLFLVSIIACATAGQKYINIAFTGDSDNIGTGKIGISDFIDNRSDTLEGYVGRRILMDNSQETYFAKGMDLGKSLTQSASEYLKSKGYSPVSSSGWELTPDGVTKASKELTYLVAGTINKFECRAQKKGAVTDMILDIDLILYVGNPEKAVLKSIPVAFSLEKTEMTFNEQKLEKFVNQSLQEMFEKALIIE